MEGIPFRVMVGLLAGAIVLAIGITAVNDYINIQTRKGFADDVISIKTTMDTLVSMSDKGSFSRVHVKIPSNCEIRFDDSKMYVNYFGENKEFSIPGHIVKPRDYGPGDYHLVIYYGEPSGDDPNRVSFE